MPTESLQDIALGYLALGWSPIPVRPRAKRALVPWLEFQQRHPREAEIRDWFRRWPEAGVAIVTGEISGLVVLDVDPAHGGEESLQQLQARFGPLPATVEAETGGGGRHLYFRHPGGVVRNRVGLAPGIDLRAEGGYVVAPPSLHPNGKPYAWRDGHDPGQRAPASMPGWLVTWLRDQDEQGGHSLGYWRKRVREGATEGERNNTIASFSGHLLWHGVDPEVVMEMMLCWNAVRCRPPLPEDEVIRTVQSITRLHRRNA